MVSSLSESGLDTFGKNFIFKKSFYIEPVGKSLAITLLICCIAIRLFRSIFCSLPLDQNPEMNCLVSFSLIPPFSFPLQLAWDTPAKTSLRACWRHLHVSLNHCSESECFVILIKYDCVCVCVQSLRADSLPWVPTGKSLDILMIHTNKQRPS